MAQLFSPLTLRDVTFAHRAWMSPMMQFAAVSAGPDEGSPTDWHLQHLGSRAVGGAALVMVEATAVDPVGRSSVYDLGLWNDRQAGALRRIVDFVSAQGAVPGIQIVHAGRKGSTGRPWEQPLTDPDRQRWPTVGASALPFGRLPAPEELSIDEIGSITAAFAASARRAADAGFRVLELHGAHGYLIHQFLSPHSNTRTDRYGGSLVNRMRFALEVVAAVRRVWPDTLPLFFRVSATDWLGGDTEDPRPGWTIADTVELALRLKDLGVDLVDVSSGGSAPDAQIAVAPGYQVPFAARVRTEAGIATSAVGLITDPDQAERIIVGEEADAVFLARELLRDPAWVRRAADHLGAELGYPPAYSRAFR
ncbi:oxidoreductase [Mycobacterium adipatum]|jgi:2,4-dienoyl-CoA reductase-like NADH-dependent reductase (Old Yellow Enzyme family)|uniref:Oxidoreductase n=1 Tax=Mycobacterium adipatum TaxID=1682113 RepID=A0A172UNV5_9MYCO|nr:NADH:flavin oxidoreductase/NADH oxidase [Mycobacterium adipatum]ANE80434.1 oxidoreductase [Mycobacterium adipatum]MBI5736133.1 NADH:flavin oxidoreductase/NADH oxidase [Mycolicibacterium neoaurum]